MVFQSIPEFSDFPYVVYHYTGTGVIEDPFVDKWPVEGFNNDVEARGYSSKLTIDNNSEQALKSSWYFNRYDVRINTANHIGKKLYDEWNRKFTRILNRPEKNCTTFTYPSGVVITIMNECLKSLNSFPRGGSWSMEMMDFSEQE